MTFGKLLIPLKHQLPYLQMGVIITLGDPRTFVKHEAVDIRASPWVILNNLAIWINITKLSVWASWGCCNTSPQIWWLKMTKIHSLTALEAKFQNQGVSRSTLPLKTWGEDLCCLFLSVVVPGMAGQPPCRPCPLFTWPSSLCHPQFSRIRTLTIRYRPQPYNLGWFHLLITAAKALFPNKVTFSVPWVRAWTYLLGGHHSTHYATAQRIGSISWAQR